MRCSQDPDLPSDPGRIPTDGRAVPVGQHLPHLVAEREHGNPETSTDAELADAARRILDDVYAEQLAELAVLFDERRSQGRTAVDVSDVARLATLGAVDTVLVDIDASVPGSIDDAGGDLRRGRRRDQLRSGRRDRPPGAARRRPCAGRTCRRHPRRRAHRRDPYAA
ncbi:MAG: hypothetical protein M5U19_20525 [Microthrixaceae bacterium]|nr:hypothetical protein [Microthrixaceae bacterium]